MRTLLLAAVLAACSSSSTPTARPEDHKPSDTGAVDEAKFKAMHEPPTAGPAKRAGHQIDLAGGKAYLSLPAGAGPHPAIIVIHEWWGLNANIEHWADRFAAQGWAALAVDLYEGKVTDTREAAMAAMKSVDETKAAAVISAAIEYVKADPRIQAPKRVVIGWCFGGGWSLQTAIAHPELDGAIIYYGQLVTDPEKLRPIKAELLGIFGSKDEGIPPASVEQFKTALAQAGVKAEIYSYDAPHAFANPSNPKYDHANAAAAWSHVVAFLDRIKSR